MALALWLFTVLSWICIILFEGPLRYHVQYCSSARSERLVSGPKRPGFFQGAAVGDQDDAPRVVQ